MNLAGTFAGTTTSEPGCRDAREPASDAGSGSRAGRDDRPAHTRVSISTDRPGGRPHRRQPVSRRDLGRPVQAERPRNWAPARPAMLGLPGPTVRPPVNPP